MLLLILRIQMYDKLVILSSFFSTPLKNEGRIKRERRSHTGFQPIFLLPQNYYYYYYVNIFI